MMLTNCPLKKQDWGKQAAIGVREDQSFKTLKTKISRKSKDSPRMIFLTKNQEREKQADFGAQREPSVETLLIELIQSPKYPSRMITLIFSLMKNGPERGKQADIGVTEEQGFEMLRVIPFFLMSSLPPPSRWPSSRSSLSTFFSLSSTRRLTSHRYRN